MILSKRRTMREVGQNMRMSTKGGVSLLTWLQSGTFLYKLLEGPFSRCLCITGCWPDWRDRMLRHYFASSIPGIHSVGMSSPPWKWETCFHFCSTALSSNVSRYSSHQVPGGV